VDIDDAYAELGLSRNAQEGDVKGAWRRLVSQWHPDRNPSHQAGLRMQRINRAFEKIRDTGFGGTAQATQTSSAQRPPEAPPRPSATREAADDPPARSVLRKLKLTLEEAALGCTRVVSGKFVDTCTACDGRGHRVLASVCTGCGGSGAQRNKGWYGLFSPPVECEPCRGSGRARQACTACAGAGKLAPRPWRLSVRIPPGVRDGDLLSVSGPATRVNPQRYVLELRIALQPHALFSLADDGRLHCRVPVDGYTWMAQRTVEVPTLDGGLHSLALQRNRLHYDLPGRGFPAERRGPRGDAVVEIEPVFPDMLSTDQQILLDQLIATMHRPGDATADPRLTGWQQALKRWLQAAGRVS